MTTTTTKLLFTSFQPKTQGGRKRCSTVAPLRGTKAKREAKRRRKNKVKEKKGRREGEKESERDVGRKEGRKKLCFRWVQASKKCCSMVVPPWVRRTRGMHIEGGKKSEGGRGG